jgi:hypothetical protein
MPPAAADGPSSIWCARGDSSKVAPRNSTDLRHTYYPPLTGWRRWVGFDSLRPDELEMESLSRDLQEIASRGKSMALHETVTVGDLVRLTL